MLSLMAVAPAGGGETKRIAERSEIEPKYLWATETIFADTAAWDAEFSVVEKRVEELGKLKGTLAQGSKQLFDALALRDDVEARVDKLYVYASLLADQDTRVGDNQALQARARSLAVRYGEATSWLQPELTAIPLEKLDGWMREDKRRDVYRQHIDNLFRQKKHILSPREEELLAMAGEVRGTPGNAYTLLKNADMQFPSIKDEKGQTVELSDSAYYLYLRSPDRGVRKACYDGIVGTYKNYRNTGAALLNGAVQSHIFNMKARNYESCRAAALDTGNIPIAVYDTLIKTVNENLPLLHRYAEIRRKTLNLTDGTHAYDLFAPFISGQSMDLTYEQAVDMITNALKPLGADYGAAMTKGFASRWVDVFPTKGKRSGAYSSGSFLTQPYILMNFHGGYEDMSTLAHEMGHSMHSHFSRAAQPYVYAEYDIFCAEVASTCNEILLQNQVLKATTDPRKKLYLLVEFLEGIRGTVFRQTMFSEFEQRIHEMAERREPLTADSMSAEFGRLMKNYYGAAYTHDELVDSEWIRIPHFYYNFYVYKYATSYCAASNIARRIMDGEPGAVEAYLEFLKAGSSKYPLEVLKIARVDMTSPQPIRDAMAIFKDLLDQTEALVEQVR
ncbi:MAG: oligoendopeptidase F [Planctomycetes bacterium]|nr:oligoendopeptidase F [Planctomycetota bacterium]